jgi:hypothetical protein
MTLDFDLNGENILKSEPLSEIDLGMFHEKIKISLPPSYVDFKTTFADSFYISSGNALSIFPLLGSKDIDTNVASISLDYAHLGNVFKVHKLLIFGMSGVDSETWAFYTNKKYPNGEYPIIWLLPSEERFFLHSSSFESFLNIQYKALTNSDNLDSYDEFYKNLVSKYDTEIKPFGYDSIYSRAQNLAELDLIMKHI